ncbi:hypothetical protein KY348_06875 [Candidatus Woesearchaeota archaeon]|nr:hypothetical protein [Candidatus Woesearchaeota archaeon]
MGFFDFLKKKEPSTLKFSEIEAWLDKQVEDKKLDQKISKAKSIIKDKVEQGYKYLEALEQAGLKNANIPERAKHVMEGHRKTYVIKLKRFLDEVEVPDDFSQLGYYSAKFSESIDNLSKETQKNYLVLREFMEEELSRIVKSVKSIEDELSRLQASIEKEGLEMIKDAKVKLKLYKDDLKKKARLEEERAAQEKEFEALKERKVKFEKRVDELKQSNDYSNYKVFLEKKKKYEEKLNELETELKTVFAELHRPLKKYKRGSLSEHIIDKYLLDPMGTLEEDDSLLVMDFLNKMKQQLDNLELKEKQLEKTMDMINKLNKDFFMSRKLEIGRLKGLNKDAATKINRSVVALNISENETWLKKIDEKTVQAEQALEELKKEIGDINLDYLKQKVKEKVKEIASVVVEED